MTTAFDAAQRIVLQGRPWNFARHLVLGFPKTSAPLAFLHRLERHGWLATGASERTDLQASLGFSRRGLERARVPPQVLGSLASKAPAFTAGAARRAVGQLGASGCNAPGSWDAPYAFETLDAVLSLHAMDEARIHSTVATIHDWAAADQVQVFDRLPMARRLGSPAPTATPRQDLEDPSKKQSKEQWTHFGYRDGLSRIRIEGWSDTSEPAPVDVANPAAASPSSAVAAGEFLLGRPQQSGANPWIAGPPGMRVWPEELRAFFRDGSFGVLQQIEQDVDGFEAFVERCAELSKEELKAKLCGRYPTGESLIDGRNGVVGDDFHYRSDPDGHVCPFGSHIRRMNPRDDGDLLAHSARRRLLLRRGMPYGAVQDPRRPTTEPRGLFGHFFCASIEDQYEHLIAHWAERIPLGSGDRGGARDPLIGSHDGGDGAFLIPRQGRPAYALRGFSPFVRTRGTAYLFYPSRVALAGVLQNSLWGALVREDR